jgi:hypothetical protein
MTKTFYPQPRPLSPAAAHLFLVRRLDSSKGEDVAQHFIVELSRGEAKIIKTYTEKGA